MNSRISKSVIDILMIGQLISLIGKTSTPKTSLKQSRVILFGQSKCFTLGALSL